MDSSRDRPTRAFQSSSARTGAGKSQRTAATLRTKWQSIIGETESLLLYLVDDNMKNRADVLWRWTNKRAIQDAAEVGLALFVGCAS